MLLFDTNRFRITKLCNKFIVDFKLYNISISLYISELISLSIMMNRFYKELNVINLLDNLIVDIRKILDEYQISFSNNLKLTIDKKLAYNIYYAIKLIIDNIAFINIMDFCNDEEEPIRVRSSEEDHVTLEEKEVILSFLNSKRLKDIYNSIIESKTTFIYNPKLLSNMNNIDTIQKDIMKIYENYNGSYEQYLEFFKLYSTYRSLYFIKNDPINKLSYLYSREVKDEELKEWFGLGLDYTINLLKRELLMVKQDTNTTSVSIDDNNNIFYANMTNAKSLILYSDNFMKVKFYDNHINMIFSDFKVEIGVDEFIEFVDKMNSYLNTNSSQNLVTTSYLITLDPVNDNDVDITITDKNSNKVNFTFSNDRILTLSIVFDKLIKYLPLYFGLTNKTGSYTDSGKKVIVFNSHSEDNVSLDNDKVPIELWNPYANDTSVTIPDDVNDETVNDFMGLANLICVIDEDKINQVTCDIVTKYVVIDPKIKQVTLDEIKAYRKKLLEFLEDPKNLYKTVNMLRLLKKYKDHPTIKYIYLKYINKERSFNRYLGLISVYLLSLMLEASEKGE